MTIPTANNPIQDPDVTAAQVAVGIDYKETFTLKAAYDSWNATRKDVTDGKGNVILTVAQQVFNLDEAWFAAHDGTFKLRQPSFYDDAEMEVRYAELSRNAKLPWRLAWLLDATVIAEVLLVESPSWFVLEKLDDRTVLYLMQHWYREWERRFRGTGAGARA